MHLFEAISFRNAPYVTRNTLWTISPTMRKQMQAISRRNLAVQLKQGLSILIFSKAIELTNTCYAQNIPSIICCPLFTNLYRKNHISIVAVLIGGLQIEGLQIVL